MSIITGLTANTAYQTSNMSDKKVGKKEEKQNESLKEASLKSENVKAEGMLSVAATYEKGNDEKESSKKNNSVNKTDHDTIEKMKADAEARTAQLRSLVEKMLLKQGEAFEEGTNIYELLREGKVEVDEEVAIQAQKEIAEDGYWGVEQTSDRLVSFAKALSGGDSSKADLLIEAVYQGFEEATKTWGDELPEISQKTLEATINKLNQWKEELNTTDTV